MLDLEKGAFRISGSGLVCNLGFDGLPGQRTWRPMGEMTWLGFIREQMVYRADYRYEDRHGPKEPKEELGNAYFRLPPWLAEVVAKKLESEDGIKQAMAIAIDFAMTFAKEAGVDVVGIAIHRENSGDLHIHLLFSLTLEREVEVKLSKRQMKALVRAMADARIAERTASNDPLAVAGRNRVRMEIAKELEAKTNMVVKRVRHHRPRPIQVLGPSFRGKLALWELSGRDDAIAAMGDRPTTESNTFRGLVAEPVKEGIDLTKTFIDLWGERWICARFSEILNDTERAKVRALGEKALANYRRWGKEKPAIEDYIVEQVRSMEPPDFQGELTTLREKANRLNKIEAAFAEAPATVKVGGVIATAKALVKTAIGVPELPAIRKELETLREKANRLEKIEAAFANAPATVKVGGVIATAKALVKAANHLEALKRVLKKVQVALPAIRKALSSDKPATDIVAELARVARDVLGKEKPEEKTIAGPV